MKYPTKYPSHYQGRKIMGFSEWRKTRQKKMDLTKESSGCINTSGYRYKGGDYIECVKHDRWKRFYVMIGNIQKTGTLDQCERFLYHFWIRDNEEARIEQAKERYEERYYNR